MNILVVGNGGREHALAWKAAQCEGVDNVFVAPGNAGTDREPGVQNVDIGVGDFQALSEFVVANGVALTLVGPEQPLVDGIRNHFDALGLACFGPSQGAAQLEGSKAFTKDFLARHHIPTGSYSTFSDYDAAADYVQSEGAPIVIKADGLAAGKGVVVAQTEAEALAALKDMLADDGFGAAGRTVVVEEFLAGEEASFICLCDGRRAVPFASSQDHKARDDGDLGPNTGGMGAYSPAPVVTPTVHERVMREIIEPTMAGMAADGHPYQGFLYAGLMIDGDGAPKVIEFNCRFGDPEAQPVLMRLDADLVALCRAALEGDVGKVPLRWRPEVALGVVMAAGGYPVDYAKGDVIEGLDDADGDYAKVFHAGTRSTDEGPVTNGGRVLCVVGLGDSVTDAQTQAYGAAAKIGWRNAYYRKDIGYRAIARERAKRDKDQ